MKIVKNWTTVELIEFMNSYQNTSKEDQVKYRHLMKAVRDELKLRQPLIGILYA